MSNPQYISAELEDLLQLIIDYRGKTPKKLNSSWTLSGIPALSAKNIKNGRIVNEASIRYVSDELYKRWMHQELLPEDILMTSEAPIGETYLVKPGEKYLLSQRLFALRANEKKINPRFLFYYFNTDEGKHELLSRSTGTTVGGIRQTALNRVIVNYPNDISYQKHITEILYNYDTLLELNEKRIKVLEELIKDLYTKWFVLMECPYNTNVSTWTNSKLEGICTYIGRGISPRYSEFPGSTVLNQKCIRKKKILLTQSRYQNKPVSESKLIKYGDILINSTGVGTLGRIAQVYKTLPETTVDSHITIVRPDQHINLDYFGITLLQMEDHFTSLGRGATGQTELSKNSIQDTTILTPPLEIQNKFSEIVSPIRHHINNIEEFNELLKDLRNILVPELISGRVKALCK